VYDSARATADVPANGSVNVLERSLMNRRVVLRSRPVGALGTEHFAIEEVPVPTLLAGQLLLRTLYLSLDPYLPGAIGDGATDAVPLRTGQVMAGGTVSRVEASRHRDYQPGDLVLGCSGWQQYALSEGADLARVDPRIDRPAQALGVLGLPGFLAYLALCKIGRPKAGETVVVAAASGAVGSLSGQIARARGCRTVVLAGTADRHRFASEEPRFDECIERGAADLPERLRAACPNGIDVYFENAGGAAFDAVLPLLNKGARVPLRGTIDPRDGTTSPQSAARLWYLARSLAAKRIKVEAFFASDHRHRYSEFVTQMRHWLDSDTVRLREDIVDGLDNAPRAFIGLLEGRRFGKLVIRVAR
jgi:NADPH-dependent curcumin reductase CurA